MLTPLERKAAIAFALVTALVLASALLLPRLAATKAHDFVRTEVMIPMRDGTKLQTAIYVPRRHHARLPILLQRGPYGIPGEEGDLDGDGVDPGLRADGYIFVFQNIRGRFKSEGEFVMQRPPRDAGARADAKAIDEGSDAYDTIDWLVKNLPEADGKACIRGTSYLGWTTAAALLDPHPALKCASERAAMGDLFLNDDFHHNGAFRLSYGFEYTAGLETTKEKYTDWDFDTLDAYDWYLRLGALSHVDERYFHGKLPTWENLVAHPSYDDFWERRAPAKYLTHSTVPNLHVAGWFDQEDFLGPMEIYASLEKTDDANANFLVVGPWNHGGWDWETTGRKLGMIDFGSDVSKRFRDDEQRKWFAHWLHDGPPLDLPEATIFETGTNEWRKYDAWPPKSGTTEKKLYLRAGGAASFDPPADPAIAAFDEYVSDPARPVPYRRRPIGPTYPSRAWKEWLTEDQRFVDRRPDVLTWETGVLDHDVVIAGDIRAELFAATSGTDADWVVKLIDVLPEARAPGVDAGGEPEPLRGYELMVTSEILRGRFRDGLSTPEPVAPGAVVKYGIDLHTRAHAFRTGHRIMVQVQSTWFPLYDRNPQRYVENIFRAKDEDFVKATQRVYRAAGAASSIVLPVVDGR
jgi:putative CocE/NonD family hydrolase